jgi:hypothetical protein
MTIDRFLSGSEGAQDLALLKEAYRLTLRSLNLVDRDDPVAELVARRVIEACRAGAASAAEVSRIAIKNLGISTSD